MEKQILVVKRELIFGEGSFQGFKPSSEIDYTQRILANHSYRERNAELESDTNFLQIIPYIWIINPEERKAFLYKRSPIYN